MVNSRMAILLSLPLLAVPTAYSHAAGPKNPMIDYSDLVSQCERIDIRKLGHDDRLVCEAALKRKASKGRAALASSSAPTRTSIDSPGFGAVGPMVPAEAKPPPCSKQLFIRADPIDNYHYFLDCPANAAADAKGASISYTNNQLAHTQTATVNGRVSYLLVGGIVDLSPTLPAPPPFFVSAYGFAPFISANGTWDQPIKKTTNNALRGGGDFAFAVSSVNFPINLQYFYISPFHQTDFRGTARIDGGNFAWEPIVPELSLGASAYRFPHPYFGFFWQFRAEAEVIEVSNPGLTKLIKGDHEWLGETTRATLLLFPITLQHDWPDWLAGRFSVIGTTQNYYDVHTAAKANYHSLALQYKLGACKKPENPKPDDPDICAIQGSSALSFEYTWGMDKETLVKVNQYMVKLSYAY
jgi:hypothetical protein